MAYIQYFVRLISVCPCALYGTHSSWPSKVTTHYYKLSLDNPLAPPPKQLVILIRPKNKDQLIDVICKELARKIQQTPAPSSFIMKGKGPLPNKVKDGTLHECFDLNTTREDADVIIPQQANRWFILQQRDAGVSKWFVMTLMSLCCYLTSTMKRNYHHWSKWK